MYRPHLPSSKLIVGLCAGLTLGWALFFATAPAKAVPPTKAQLVALLSGYEDVPPPSAFRAFGPGTLAILVELYDDAAQPPFVRLRAVRAAAHYRTPATRTFLLAIARAPGQRDLFIRAAVVSLGRAFGEGAIGDVAPFLAHSAPAVREGAVIALERIDAPAATNALAARIPAESASHISARIRRVIAERRAAQTATDATNAPAPRASSTR